MFYRIRENKLYDYADYKYAEDCLELKGITQLEVDSNPEKVIVEDGVLVINPEYPTLELERAKALKKKEALDKAYEYEKVGTFAYTAESVKTGEDVEVHIEFKPDNLTKL